VLGRIAEGTRAKAVRLEFSHSSPRPLAMIGNFFQSSPTGTCESFDFDLIWSRDLHKIIEARSTALIQRCVNEGLKREHPQRIPPNRRSCDRLCAIALSSIDLLLLTAS
jgi:hypothetical protein